LIGCLNTIKKHCVSRKNFLLLNVLVTVELEGKVELDSIFFLKPNGQKKIPVGK